MGSVIERHGKNGTLYYLSFFDADGTQRTHAAKHTDGTRARTHREATALLHDAEAKVRAGVKVAKARATEAEKRQQTITIRELVARFIVEARPKSKAGYQANKRVITNYRNAGKSMFDCHVLARLGDDPAASIDSLAIEKLRDQILDADFALDTCGKAMTYLSSLYEWARRERLIACINPVRGVARPKAKAGTLDYLTAAECGAFLAWLALHAAPMLHAMVTLALMSGMRKGELFGLMWKRLDFAAKRVDVEASYDSQTKTGEARSLDLHADAIPVLKCWQQLCPANSGALVFPVAGGKGGKPTPKKAPVWRMGHEGDMLGIGHAMQMALGRQYDRPWYLLRHSFASNFVIAGGSLYALQKMLGHTDPKMTMRYAKLSPAFLGQEVARLSFPAPKPDATVTRIDVARARREVGRILCTDVTESSEPSENTGE